MTSAFAAPMIRARYGAVRMVEKSWSANQNHLIFCNLAFRRKLLPVNLRFREDLVSNQESLFLYECLQEGLKIQFFPQLFVYHRRRKTVLSFFLQIFSYGFGRAQQSVNCPTSSHPAFFAPSIVIASLPLLWQRPELWGIYLLLAFFGAVDSRNIRQLGWRAIVLAVPMTAIIHLAYGLGMWRGFFHQASRIFPFKPVRPPEIVAPQRTNSI